MRKLIALIAFVLTLMIVGRQFMSVHKNDSTQNSTEPVVMADNAALLDADKVYLFTKKGCPYCTQAIEHIQANYPNFGIEIRDISVEENLHLALACAKRFHMPKNMLGTPLICMQNDFILGWGPDAPAKLAKYVADHTAGTK